jgi:hypothetical protein
MKKQYSAWTYVGVAFGVLVVDFIFVPAFAYALGDASYIALPGTVAAALGGLVCIWAFLSCPRTHRIPKAVCLLCLVAGLFVALYCTTRYVYFGLR